MHTSYMYTRRHQQRFHDDMNLDLEDVEDDVDPDSLGVFKVAPDNFGDLREKASRRRVKIRPTVGQRNDDDHRDRMPGPTPLPHSIR